MAYQSQKPIDVGGGVAAIASIGRGGGNGRMKYNIPGALSSPQVWSWIIFLLCIAWLLGLFAAFGGYKGDVAS